MSARETMQDRPAGLITHPDRFFTDLVSSKVVDFQRVFPQDHSDAPEGTTRPTTS
jgi:hypothetical protein